MEIIYKNYEPNKGFEEIQGKLYSMNNDHTVTGEEIRERFEKEKIEPQSVIYAFTKDCKPLAYIQARDYPDLGQVHMGRPWATPECPEEVKKKLFQDLFDYMIKRKTELKLLMTTNLDPMKEKLAKENNMSIERNWFQFEFTKVSLAKFDRSPYKYSIRKATNQDMEAIHICRNLAYQQDPNDRYPRLIEYLKTYIEAGYFYLLYEDNNLIAAASARKPNIDDDKTNLEIPIIFTLLEKEEGIPILLDHLISVAYKENWKKNHILLRYTDENEREMEILRSVAAKEEKTNIRYIQT